MKMSMWKRSALLALAVVTLAASPASDPAPPSETPPVAVVGRGFWESLTCLGCGISVYGLSGGTVFGFVVLAATYPDVIGACALACVAAVETM